VFPLNITLTAKIRLLPQPEEETVLLETGRAFSKACDFVSGVVFDTHNLNQFKLQDLTYSVLRSEYNMPSQMAINAIRHVIGNYKTIRANQGEWIKPNYRHTTYPLTWNRDYLLRQGYFSIGTLQGRLKIPFSVGGMEKYFDGSWSFGAAKVVCKHSKWFLHVSMSKNIDALQQGSVSNVLGIDMGINFLTAAYGTDGKTTFENGKPIKHKRAHYKRIRQQLQKRQTSSARKRLRAIGSRENRWMQDVNHCVSKALVESNPKGSAFFIEDLTGIRNATERVRTKDRYVSVSWAFFDLRQKLEYKARMNGQTVIALDPKHTSQTCPKCGHTERGNRNKKYHLFCCKTCDYKSNDDRIGAMNLHRKGIEYLSAVASE
jgi:IS605 OrfB family transposase